MILFPGGWLPVKVKARVIVVAIYVPKETCTALRRGSFYAVGMTLKGKQAWLTIVIKYVKHLTNHTNTVQLLKSICVLAVIDHGFATNV
jgi:hypothetical protein